MKKLFATVFCAAFTLPVMASSMSNTDSATDETQTSRQGHSAQMESTNPNADSGSTTNMEETPTGRQGESAQMESTNPDGTAAGTSTNMDETDTGHQGHSAQMESTEPMDEDTSNQ